MRKLITWMVLIAALGLDHVADPESLMYPVNKGGDLKLTDSDLGELDRVCG